MPKSFMQRAGERLDRIANGAARIWKKQRAQQSLALQGAKGAALLMAPEMLMLSWYPVAWVFTYFFGLAAMIKGESTDALDAVDEDSIDFFIDGPTMPTSFLRALVDDRLTLSTPMMTIFVIGFSFTMLVDTILPFIAWGGIADAMAQLALAGIQGAGFFAVLGATIFALDFARVAINEYYPNFFPAVVEATMVFCNTVARFAKMVWNQPIRIFEPVVTAQHAYEQVIGKGMVGAKEGAEQGVANPYAEFARVPASQSQTYLLKDGQVVLETVDATGAPTHTDVTQAASLVTGMLLGAAAAYSSVLASAQPRVDVSLVLPNLDDPQPADDMVDVSL